MPSVSAFDQAADRCTCVPGSCFPILAAVRAPCMRPVAKRRRETVARGPCNPSDTRMKATPDSPRMFESDFIDAFSRTHPAIVGVLFAPAAAFLFWYGIARAGVPLLLSAVL